MIHYPPNANVDPIYLGIGISISLLALAFFIRHEKKGRRKPELSSATVDNVETLAFGIAVQISRCKNDKDLNKAVEAIGKYEWQFEGNPVAQQEAKELKRLLASKADEVYGVETIVS